MVLFLLTLSFFFFSSRRRHTRSTRDWSSDVCSSDLHPHRAASWSETTAARLVELARDDRVVAIGEAGMDLSGRSAPHGEQERALRARSEERRVGKECRSGGGADR